MHPIYLSDGLVRQYSIYSDPFENHHVSGSEHCVIRFNQVAFISAD